jgi:hypothetical protein
LQKDRKCRNLTWSFSDLFSFPSPHIPGNHGVPPWLRANVRPRNLFLPGRFCWANYTSRRVPIHRSCDSGDLGGTWSFSTSDLAVAAGGFLGGRPTGEGAHPTNQGGPPTARPSPSPQAPRRRLRKRPRAAPGGPGRRWAGGGQHLLLPSTTPTFHLVAAVGIGRCFCSRVVLGPVVVLGKH